MEHIGTNKVKLSSCVLPIQCIYMFNTIVPINTDYFPELR